jgi:hypothetical protein
LIITVRSPGAFSLASSDGVGVLELDAHHQQAGAEGDAPQRAVGGGRVHAEKGGDVGGGGRRDEQDHRGQRGAPEERSQHG